MEASLSPTTITRSSMLVKTPALVECRISLVQAAISAIPSFVFSFYSKIDGRNCDLKLRVLSGMKKGQ